MFTFPLLTVKSFVAEARRGAGDFALLPLQSRPKLLLIAVPI
jgi:hypothetical protein